MLSRLQEDLAGPVVTTAPRLTGALFVFLFFSIRSIAQRAPYFAARAAPPPHRRNARVPAHACLPACRAIVHHSPGAGPARHQRHRPAGRTQHRRTKRRAEGICPKEYHRRHVMEHLIGHLKECRHLAPRFEKLARHDLEMVKLACIRYILNRYFSETAWQIRSISIIFLPLYASSIEQK